MTHATHGLNVNVIWAFPMEYLREGWC